MSFNWSEFVTLAHALQQDPSSPGPEEACLRSAISRAYYGVFCTVRARMRDRGAFKPTYTGKDHSSLPMQLQKSTNPVQKKVGLDLDRLRLNRRKADYDDVVANPSSLAEQSVHKARELLAVLKSLDL
jgi:uncharacterized protein (UPF0332 family)